MRQAFRYHSEVKKIKAVNVMVNYSVQFFFQTVYVLPSLVLSLTGSTGSDWTDLVNWRMLSIALSFASFSRSFYSIR